MSNAPSRVLLLGGSGMLGHKLLHVLHRRFNIFATCRSEDSMQRCHTALPGWPVDHLLPGIDAMNFPAVRDVIENLAPSVVVNCIGVVKQSDVIGQAIPSIELNALLPHQLAQLCSARSIRLIHFSTDCVFSGRQGNYSESDLPDPGDLYGRSKLLGELDQPGCLTLRTSIVGWELEHHRSLLGWFASQRGQRIQGYRKAIFTGLSTAALACLVGELIERWPQLHGVYHAASTTISKFDLLSRLQTALHWEDIDIQPNDSFACDRSLNAARLHQATGWTAPPWSVMIRNLAREWADYERGVLSDAAHDV